MASPVLPQVESLARVVLPTGPVLQHVPALSVVEHGETLGTAGVCGTAANNKGLVRTMAMNIFSLVNKVVKNHRVDPPKRTPL